jgi:phage-related protein
MFLQLQSRLFGSAASRTIWSPFLRKSCERSALHIYEAQKGNKHPSAKPLHSFGGAGVLEIVEDHDGDTYRAVYTVRLAGRVYVLHAFQKKSRHGISTPQAEIDRVKARLRKAENSMPRGWRNEKDKANMVDNIKVEVGSGNVFADLGLPERRGKPREGGTGLTHK